jgi:hypothetical protein
MAPACSTARPTSIANAVEVADKFKAVESLRANPLYSVAIWLAALDEVALLAVCLFIISFSIISDFIFHQGAWAPHIELINADDVARETLFGVKKLYSAHKSAFPSYNFPNAYWGVSNICKGIVEGRKTKSLPHTVRFYLLVYFLFPSYFVLSSLALLVLTGLKRRRRLSRLLLLLPVTLLLLPPWMLTLNR